MHCTHCNLCAGLVSHASIIIMCQYNVVSKFNTSIPILSKHVLLKFRKVKYPLLFNVTNQLVAIPMLHHVSMSFLKAKASSKFGSAPEIGLYPHSTVMDS